MLFKMLGLCVCRCSLKKCFILFLVFSAFLSLHHESNSPMRINVNRSEEFRNALFTLKPSIIIFVAKLC